MIHLGSVFKYRILIQMKLQKQLSIALQQGDRFKAAQITAEIKALKYEEERNKAREQVSAKMIVDKMSKEDRSKTLSFLNKIPVFADALEDCSIGLLEKLKKSDPTIDIPMILDDVKTIQKASERIRHLVDSIGDYEFSETFGDMCDRVKLVVDNEFSRVEAKMRRKNTKIVTL